jgi:outer membrane protein TolC
MAIVFLGQARPILLTSLLAVSVTVSAETRLPVAQLVQQVSAENLELAALYEVNAEAAAMASSQGRLPDPQLMIGFAPDTAGTPLGSREIIKFSQSLPWFGKRRASKTIAESSANASVNATHAFQRNIALSATKAWAEWWYVHQALMINQTILQSFEGLTRSANTRYQNGQGKQQDALQSEVRLLHAKHQRVTLQQQKQRIGFQLNALRNRSLERTVLPPASIPAMPQPLHGDSLMPLLNQHPSYLAALDALEGADAQLKLAKRDRYPDFVAEAAYIGTLDPEEKRWQVGLGFNIPFDQGKRRHGETAANANKQKLALQAESKLLALKEQLGLQLSRYEEHQHIEMLYAEQLLPVAKQSQQAAQQDYANGLSDFDTVTTAITDYQKTAMQLRRHQADRLVILAELEQLLGRSLRDSHISLRGE